MGDGLQKPATLRAGKVSFPHITLIHATASHGGPFLFDALDAALWLLAARRKGEGDGGTRHIDVVFHPVMPAFTFRGLLGAIRRGMIRFLTSGLGRLPAWLFIRKLQPESLYSRVFEKRESVVVHTALGSISLRLARLSWTRTARATVESYFEARKTWRSCCHNDGLDPNAFLSLTDRSVLVGDLIAASALRHTAHAGGSLRRCQKLFAFLHAGLWMSHYALNDIAANGHESCVFVSEVAYMHGIYRRALHARGVHVLDPGPDETHGANFSLFRPQDIPRSPFIACSNDSSLAEPHANVIRTYLMERLGQPKKHLFYMAAGHNRADSALITKNGSVPEICAGQFYAVLFLHSFDDGQYLFGVDGFEDLYDWTVFTINRLIANKSISRVFIKEHPGVANAFCAGNNAAVSRLEATYKNDPRVCWLQPDTSALAFVKSGRFVGITHHGSVAEELVFCGIPVIASSYAPWTTEYKFLKVWISPVEYGEIINNLSFDTWKQPNALETIELYRYIKDYRLKAHSVSQCTAWLKYALWRDGRMPLGNRETYSEFGRILDDLSLDTGTGSGFLEFLTECQLGQSIEQTY